MGTPYRGAGTCWVGVTTMGQNEAKAGRLHPQLAGAAWLLEVVAGDTQCTNADDWPMLNCWDDEPTCEKYVLSGLARNPDFLQNPSTSRAN